MDVREKYVMQKVNRKEKSICPNCIHHNLCIAENNQPCFECNRFIDANGVTVQEWIPVTERLPEDLPENKGKKVINCIVAHSPYANGKLTSQFRQRKWDNWDNKWYWSKIGGCTVTHWMPLPQPPKGE